MMTGVVDGTFVQGFKIDDVTKNLSISLMMKPLQVKNFLVSQLSFKSRENNNRRDNLIESIRAVL